MATRPPIWQVKSKMQSSHLQLIDLLTDDFRFAGVPEHSLTTLVHLREEMALEDAGAFNVASKYKEATERALREQQTVFDSLISPLSWEQVLHQRKLTTRNSDIRAPLPPSTCRTRQSRYQERAMSATWPRVRQGTPTSEPAANRRRSASLRCRGGRQRGSSAARWDLRRRRSRSTPCARPPCSRRAVGTSTAPSSS
jgi:hypothetical protein